MKISPSIGAALSLLTMCGTILYKSFDAGIQLEKINTRISLVELRLANLEQTKLTQKK